MVDTGNTKEWVWYAFVCRSAHDVTIITNAAPSSQQRIHQLLVLVC
jgi:hypothetical protein